MASLADLLAAAAGADKTRTTILPEAQIETLREFGRAYELVQPFNVGDLVTPTSLSGMLGAGEPHLVVDVAPFASPIFDAAECGPASSGYGNKPQVRIATFDGNRVSLFWCETWQLEPYRADTKQAAE